MVILQLLRNKSLYASHELAVQGIKNELTSKKDGELIIASYGSSGNAKTIMGVKHHGSITIFDNEVNETNINNIINGLDANVDSTGGTLVSAKIVEENGVITSMTINDTKLVSRIDGEVKKINDKIGTKEDASSKDTVYGAIKKAKEDAINSTNVINGLNLSSQKESKKFVSNITQTKGKVSIEKNEIKAASDGVVSITDSNNDIVLDVNVDGKSIKKETGKISAKVDGKTILVDESEGLKGGYKLVKKTKGLPETALAVYELQDAKSNVIGDGITIPKDQHLKDAKLINKGGAEGVTEDTLRLVYVGDKGQDINVDIAVGSFLREAEFKANNGFEVLSGGEVKIKIDETNDHQRLLTLGENGLLFNGDSINDEIKTVANKAEHNYSKIGAETARSQEAEKEIADKVGLTGDEKNRTFTPSTNYGSGSTSIVNNIQKIDIALKGVSDKANTAVQTITAGQAINVEGGQTSKTISVKVSKTAGNRIEAKEDGIFVSNIIDCGEY